MQHGLLHLRIHILLSSHILVTAAIVCSCVRFSHLAEQVFILGGVVATGRVLNKFTGADIAVENRIARCPANQLIFIAFRAIIVLFVN